LRLFLHESNKNCDQSLNNLYNSVQLQFDILFFVCVIISLRERMRM